MRMKYLLDTNVLVDYLRGKLRIQEFLFQSSSAISIITLAELYYGAYKSEDVKAAIKEVLETISDFSLGVVTLGEKDVKTYGELKASLEKGGERIEDLDLLIAGTALALDLTLVTRNIKHFQRIKGLKLLPA